MKHRGLLFAAVGAICMLVGETSALAGSLPVLVNKTDQFYNNTGYNRRFIAYTNGDGYGGGSANAVYVSFALHAEDKVLRGDGVRLSMYYQGSEYHSSSEDGFGRSATYKKWLRDVRSRTLDVLPEDNTNRGTAILYRFETRFPDMTSWTYNPSTTGTYRQVFDCNGSAEFNTLNTKIPAMRDWDRRYPGSHRKNEANGLPGSWFKGLQNAVDGNMMTPHGWNQRQRMGMFRSKASVIDDIIDGNLNTSPGLDEPDGIMYENRKQQYYGYVYPTGWGTYDETQSMYRTRVKGKDYNDSSGYRARGYTWTADHSLYPPSMKYYGRGGTSESCIGSDHWDIHEVAYHYYGDDDDDSTAGHDLGATLTPYKPDYNNNVPNGGTVISAAAKGWGANHKLNSNYYAYDTHKIGTMGNATSVHARIWDLHIWDLDSYGTTSFSVEKAINKFQPSGESGIYSPDGGGIYGSKILKTKRLATNVDPRFLSLECDDESNATDGPDDINNDTTNPLRAWDQNPYDSCGRVFMTYEWGRGDN